MTDARQVSARPRVNTSAATSKLAEIQQAHSEEVVVSPPAKFQCLASTDEIEFSPSNMLVCFRHVVLLLPITSTSFGRDSVLTTVCLSVYQHDKYKS